MSVLKFVLNYVLLLLIPCVLVFLFSFVFVYKYVDVIHSFTFIVFYIFYSLIMLIGLGCSDDKDGVKIIK